MSLYNRQRATGLAFWSIPLALFCAQCAQPLSPTPIATPRITDTLPTHASPTAAPLRVGQASKERALSSALAGTYPWLTDLQDPNHLVRISPDTPLLWGVGWCATSPETLTRNLGSLSFRLQVGGQVLDPDTYAIHDFAGTTPFLPSYCRTHFVLLHSWPQGSIPVQSSVVISTPVNDGVSDYPPSTIAYDHTVLVSSVPTDSSPNATAPYAVRPPFPTIRGFMVYPPAPLDTTTSISGALVVSKATGTSSLSGGAGPPSEAPGTYALALPALSLKSIPANFFSLTESPSLLVSPDRSRAAGLIWESDAPARLGLLNSAGQLSMPGTWPPTDPYFTDIIGWRNDEGLFWSTTSDIPGTVHIFDLASGEDTPLAPAFPRETDEGAISSSSRTHVPFVFYNPDLTAVVVPRSIDPEYGPATGSLELLDVSDSTLLWSQLTWAWASSPEWSPEGDDFAITYFPRYQGTELDWDEGCQELHRVSTEGTDTMLASCVWGPPSWSPDGNLIAVWWTLGDQPTPEAHCTEGYVDAALGVIDPATGDTDVYAVCLVEGIIPQSQRIVWSPDQRYLAFNAWSNDGATNHIIAVDIDTKSSLFLLRDAFIMAWLTDRAPD